jgi:hypothetical protein
MTVTRRQALGLFGLGATLAVSGCSVLNRTPQPKLLASTAPLRKPYGVPLPLPAVATPYHGRSLRDGGPTPPGRKLQTPL